MNWSHLNWLDYGILGILGFSTVVSLMRGFVKEAISLAVWIAAIWAGFHYSSMIGEHYFSMVEPAGARAPLAFFAILIIVLIVGAIISFVISRMVSGSGLSFIDRFFGMIFGFARGVLLVAVLIMAFQVSAFAKNVLESSQLAVYFEELSQWLKNFVPEEFNQVKTTMTGQGIIVPPIGSGNTVVAPIVTPPAAPTPDAATQAPAAQVQQPVDQSSPQTQSKEPAQQLPSQHQPQAPAQSAPAPQSVAPSITPIPPTTPPEQNAPSDTAPNTPTTAVPAISPQTT